MNSIFALSIPLIFLLSFAYAIKKKVKIYDSFTKGVSNAFPLILSIFPYIATVTMLCKLLEVSGVESFLSQSLRPFFSFTGVPQEISSLIFIKPLSGSGSIAVLSDILQKYGVDSYISKCACVVYGSSETIFYISAVYFAGIKRKTLPTAICIALLSYISSILFGCFLCKIL